MEDNQKKNQMEDDQKIEDGRQPRNSKWKTTNKIKVKDDPKILNGRRPKKRRKKKIKQTNIT